MKEKFKTILILLAFVVNANLAKSQAPFGQVRVTNCYQKVEGGTGIYNFLKGNGPGGTNKVHIEFTNALDLNYFSIYKINSPGSTTPTYTWLTDAGYTGAFDYTTSEDYIRITPVLKPGAFSPAIPFDINFVDPIFIVTDKDKPCLPFENFKLNFYSNLSNICDYTLTLKLPPGTPPPGFPSYNNIGLFPNPGWSKDITDKNGSLSQTLPINSEYCDTTIVPPTPEVNRCFTFDLDIMIKPCILDDPECPPLTFTQSLTFCCNCELFVK
jgi:hypothetical protein